jgi:tetratricopeptide (TPR) repeat protein
MLYESRPSTLTGTVTMLALNEASAERLRTRGEMITYTREGKLTLALAAGLNEITRLETRPQARSELAGVLVEVGQLQHALGRSQLAEASFLRAIALYEEEQLEQPEPMAATTELAILYRREGKLGDALRLQRAAYPKLLEWLGPAHPDVIESEGELAKLELALGNFDEAEPLFRARLKRARAAHDRQSTMESRRALASIRRAKMRPFVAENSLGLQQGAAGTAGAQSERRDGVTTAESEICQLA